MWPFNRVCSHPFDSLSVEQKETVKIKCSDFETVTYHFHCSSCGKNIDKGYSRLRKSVEDFLRDK